MTEPTNQPAAERALRAAMHTIEGYRHGNESHDLADEVLPLIRAALTTTPAASGPLLHWPFAAKHDNCAECERFIEPIPKQDALPDAPTTNAATGAQTCVFRCACCQRDMELRIDGKGCNECATGRHHAAQGLNLFRQLVSGKNALRQLNVFACNSGEHDIDCKCFWKQCETWARADCEFPATTTAAEGEREQFLAHIDKCDLVARIREAVEALRAPYLIQASDAYRYEAIEAALAAIDRVTSSQTEPTDPPET